ncbi:type IV pilus modification protein PilV [Niveibacterium terrae]|uniref:type IV pilus modification protein PilV n=1 Tax=Niveibacterium terrae TaxID=3373598 RepID=UPI003A8FC2C0
MKPDSEERKFAMKAAAQNKYLNRAKGMILLENLVSMLLISFALLGMAGLIIKTLSREKESVYHSLAAVQAQDIAERMRANKSAFTAGTYLSKLNATDTAPASQSCSAGGFGAAATPAACTTVKLAEDDAYSWRQWIAKSLPGGIGIVCQDDSPDDGTIAAPACAGGSKVVVKIFWRDKKNGGRATDSTDTQRFVMVFQP